MKARRRNFNRMSKRVPKRRDLKRIAEEIDFLIEMERSEVHVRHAAEGRPGGSYAAKCAGACYAASCVRQPDLLKST